MKNYTAIYFKYFGFGIDDVVPCEVCGKRAQDIHYIHGRGKGKDVIENLMAVCRDHHKAAHGEANTYLHPDMMQKIHDKYLMSHAV